MDWSYGVVEEGGTHFLAIKSKKGVVVNVDNLKEDYVRDIINKHNESISEAMEEGVKIAREVYKGGKNEG